MTYSYAILAVSPATFAEIEGKLHAANYEAAIHADGELDMHGIALVPLKAQSAAQRYVEHKRCCTVCDSRKICHVCGCQTLFACSDCGINFHATVYVCQNQKCRTEHERKYWGDKP